MKITNDYNPYSHYAAKTKGVGEVFAEMLANGMKASNSESQPEKISNVAAVFEHSNNIPISGTQNSDVDWDKHEQICRRFFDAGNKLMGIDTTRKPNEESTGDKTLTDEQIASLREKYDVENLSPQERYDLMCDLTDMGVLSMRDILSGCIGTSPMSTISVVSQSGTSNGPIKPWRNIKDGDMLAELKWQMEDSQFGYDYINYIMKLGEKEDLELWDKKNIQNYSMRLPLIEQARVANEKKFDIYSSIARPK